MGLASSFRTLASMTLTSIIIHSASTTSSYYHLASTSIPTWSGGGYNRAMSDGLAPTSPSLDYRILLSNTYKSVQLLAVQESGGAFTSTSIASDSLCGILSTGTPF